MEIQKQPEFPLYVRLDDGEVLSIESHDKILYHLEAVDIENDEYLFWDALGDGVKVSIKKSRVSGFRSVENRMTLQNACFEYAKQLGASIESGTPQEMWAKVQAIKDRLPKRWGLLSRLFGRGKG
jgi:hypothetical protein